MPSKKKKKARRTKAQNPKKSGKSKSTRKHRASSSKRKSASTKKMMRTASAAAKATSKTLTRAEAQQIVVNNTPEPENFNGPDQLLKELGIFGDAQVPGHKAGIIADVEAKGLSLDENDIQSGPGIDVATCRDSVKDNAK